MNMRSAQLRDIRRRCSEASWHRLTGTRRGGRRTVRPGLEFLEERVTPTASITITNAFVVIGSDQSLASVSAGDQVAIHADFNTLGLPSDASYQIAYDVNGVTIDSAVVSYGAGESGTSSFYYYQGTFDASPGTNQVTVSIVPQSPAKGASAGYSTNTYNFSFSAVPPRGQLPFLHGFSDPRGLWH